MTVIIIVAAPDVWPVWSVTVNVNGLGFAAPYVREVASGVTVRVAFALVSVPLEYSTV